MRERIGPVRERGREVPSVMNTQSTIESGDGSRRVRDVRRKGRAGSFCLTLALWIGASTAMAAEVVEIRVGRHAEFTRVVFELDRAAGYRIERQASAAGPELVVSLEASSAPRRIESGKGLIEKVELVPSGSRSVARIALARDGLALKEMILANPPRIVLDVLMDQPVATRPAPKADKPTARTAPETEAASKVARAPVIPAKPAAPPTTPTPTTPTPPEVAPPAGQPEPVKVTQAFDAAEFDAAEKGVDKAAEDLIEAAAQDIEETAEAARAEIGSSVDQMMAEIESAGSGREAADPPAARPTPRAEESRPKASGPPMVAKTKPSTAETEGGWTTWALVAVGAIVLMLGGLAWARRRGGEEVDFEEPEEDAFSGDGSRAAAGTNPFADLGADEQTVPGGADEQAVLGDMGILRGADLRDSEEKRSESFFYEDSEEENMEVISRDAVNESLGMPPTSGAISEEFQQLVREMQRRMEALEGRVDELVDARDRLERQVAAQTEELRVQRAAIARTQRAVRNLARPEDEEQEPTEPALRDPSKPGSHE